MSNVLALSERRIGCRALRPAPGSDHGRSAPCDEAHDKGDHEDDQEHKEQDLSDSRGRRSHAAKAEQTGNYRDDQKNKSPIKHSLLRSRLAREVELPGPVFFSNRAGFKTVPDALLYRDRIARFAPPHGEVRAVSLKLGWPLKSLP